MARSEYTNVTKKDLLRYLRHLADQNSELILEKATKHALKLSHPNARRSYPVPINHPRMADWVVEATKKWLCDAGICTADEFNGGIKKK